MAYVLTQPVCTVSAVIQCILILCTMRQVDAHPSSWAAETLVGWAEWPARTEQAMLDWLECHFWRKMVLPWKWSWTQG